ncbi:MAG TPA: aldehyde dehydrogenase family protein, partial [Tepidisphaeraceae bacterium]|nr:aldehyde dehydrogenase family protein [Tepidisphaeraceae bacterium]
MGGPAPAAGAHIVEPATDEHGGVAPAVHDPKARSEGPLLEVRAPNKRNGRTVIYQVKVVVATKSEHAEQVAARVRTGVVAINSSTILDMNSPFGGFKKSGIGRELLRLGLVAVDEGEFATLVVTEEGAAALRERRRITLTKSMDAP